jgi:hypothetical protein
MLKISLGSMRLKRPLLSMDGRSGAILMAGVAHILLPMEVSAQDLVMRRPLPRDAQPGGLTPNPSETPGSGGESSPGGTPTPASTPGPAETSAPGTSSNIACGSAKADLMRAKWVETGWADQVRNPDSCYSQSMGYTCQADYACRDDVGKVVNKVRVWDPDATCENYDGDMETVPIPDDGRSYPAVGNAAEQAAWILVRARKLSQQPFEQFKNPIGYEVYAGLNSVDAPQVYFTSRYDGSNDPSGTPRLRIGLHGYDNTGGLCREFAKQAGRTCSFYGPDGMWFSIVK